MHACVCLVASVYLCEKLWGGARLCMCAEAYVCVGMCVFMWMHNFGGGGENPYVCMHKFVDVHLCVHKCVNVCVCFSLWVFIYVCKSVCVCVHCVFLCVHQQVCLKVQDSM